MLSTIGDSIHHRDRTLVGRRDAGQPRERSDDGLVVSPQPQENGRILTLYDDLLTLLPAQPRNWLSCAITHIAAHIATDERPYISPRKDTEEHAIKNPFRVLPCPSVATPQDSPAA
jgi:hypothetical protein